MERVSCKETESEKTWLGAGSWENGRVWENASPDLKNATEKRPQINWVSIGIVPTGVLASTFCPSNGFWVGWGRGWWYRTHSSAHVCGPCSLLVVGFWRSKFDPSLTQRETFHLDEQFTVPVDMMQARTYPLRWFSLEQPEIQVTLDCPGWVGVLGAGKGAGRYTSIFFTAMALGHTVLKGLTMPTQRD